MKLRPVEYNVIIKPKSREKKSAGGIIFTDKTIEADKLAADEGEIVAVSALAFNYDDYPAEDRPKVGDVVKFSRYAGLTIYDDKGDIEFRVVKDKDIWVVVEDGLTVTTPVMVTAGQVAALGKFAHAVEDAGLPTPHRSDAIGY